MSNEQQYGQSFWRAAQPADPSVAYADAVLNGDSKVTVKAPDGKQITYKIGQEHRLPR